MILKTKRLILRPFRKSDVDDLVKNANNLNVSQYLGEVSYPYTKKDAEWFINSCSKKLKVKPCEDYSFGIEFKTLNKIIGVVSLTKVDSFHGKASLGYWLGENYWRQGIMSEAVKAIIDFGFNTLKLRRISVSAFTPNKNSNALIKKMGFKKEGLRRKYFKAKSTGKIYDTNFYGLLKEEWVKHKKKLK